MAVMRHRPCWPVAFAMAAAAAAMQAWYSSSVGRLASVSASCACMQACSRCRAFSSHARRQSARGRHPARQWPCTSPPIAVAASASRMLWTLDVSGLGFAGRSVCCRPTSTGRGVAVGGCCGKSVVVCTFLQGAVVACWRIYYPWLFLSQ